MNLGKQGTLTSSHTAGIVEVCIQLILFCFCFFFSCLIAFIYLFNFFFVCFEMCVFPEATRGDQGKIRVPEQGAEAMTFRLCSTSHWAVGGSGTSKVVKLKQGKQNIIYTLSLFFSPLFTLQLKSAIYISSKRCFHDLRKVPCKKNYSILQQLTYQDWSKPFLSSTPLPYCSSLSKSNILWTVQSVILQAIILRIILGFNETIVIFAILRKLKC